ncbi:MAG: hypothetical protein QOJ53_2205 [Sphingomonadales bacterium]|nr:hypothetical protein [Sphingomonadales bacterium]MEA3047873.1 hypothetical protein [Sphingomonadales bacterium]
MARVLNRKIAYIGLPVCYAMLLLLSQAGGQAQAQSSREQEQALARLRAIPEGDDDERPTDPACIRILGSEHCAAEERALAATLVQNGPRGIAGQAPEKPSVVGFVRQGWPLTIEFQPQPGTFTIFRVKLYHRRLLFPYFEVAYRRVLDPDGSGGRQIVDIGALDLSGDPGAGDGARIARYDIRSYRLVGGALQRRHGFLVRAPVALFGLSAGPEAHGSLTLRNVRFLGRTTIGRRANGSAPILFSYALDVDYDAVAAELLRCPRLCASLGDVGTNLATRRTPAAQAQWAIGPDTQPGSYEIVVRAWGQCGGGSQADMLARCRHKSAWSIGRTDPRLQIQ